MEEKIRYIIHKELREEIDSIQEIIGLGQVNRVYEIKGKRKDYIIRLNEDLGKEIEYEKEKWCLNEMNKLGVMSPEVIKLGKDNDLIYMIQEKINGINGKLGNQEEKIGIWYKLGVYVKQYQKVKRIKVKQFEENEFHDNWESRLKYNINELDEEDSLLKNNILSKEEQKKSITKLLELKGKGLKEGLVHGDLCPRNVILSKEGVYLLDWGTAEINVVPHHEIGLVMMSNEANEKEFVNFLKGLGITKIEYQKMEEEILKLNFLHRLDKYRWAESYDKVQIEEYGIKIREAFEKIK